MNKIALGCAVLLMSIVAAHAADDPLAPAREGKLLCNRPNKDHKTCLSINSYTFKSDGTISNSSTSLLSPTQPVTMTTVTSVAIRNGAYCGRIRKEDLDASVFQANGQKLPDAQAAQLRAQIAGALASLIGKEICTTFVPDADGLQAQAKVDGTSEPKFNRHVIWIAPGEGYTIRFSPN